MRGSRETIQGGQSTTAAQTSPSSTSAAAAAATSPTTTSATTAAAITQAQQGPVGQPGSTPLSPGGPTPFTYVTTDANGNPVVTSGTFTPSFPATTPYTPTGSGTILGYSAWLSMISSSATGQPTASQAANTASPASVSVSLLLGALSIAIIGVVGRSIAILL